MKTKSNSSASSAFEAEQELTSELLAGARAASDLEQYGLEGLKLALVSRGIKAGGTVQERAKRLFLVKDLAFDDIPRKLKSK